MRRRVTLGIALGFCLLLILDAIAVRVGIAPGAIPRVSSTVAWTTSRAAGVTAFLALSLELLFGLFVSTSALDRVLPRARSVEVHRWLSSLVLGMIATHALVLSTDSFVRFDVLDALLPFFSSYRSFAVSLGVLAAYAALVVHVSFRLRRWIGNRIWRKLHYLSFFVFAAAVVHGLLAGSDTGTPVMQTLYLTASALVALLTAYRGIQAWSKRQRPPARA